MHMARAKKGNAAREAEGNGQTEKQIDPAILARPRLLVVGDGLSALGTVAAAVLANWRVTWISTGTARVLSPAPVLDSVSVAGGGAAGTFALLAEKHGVPCGLPRPVSAVREFRTKAFREPVWMKVADTDARRLERDDSYWIPETRFIPTLAIGFDRPLGEIERDLRRVLLAHDAVERIETGSTPICGLEMSPAGSDSDETVRVVLGSGQKISGRRLVYADRWSKLAAMDGLPKPIPFARGRQPSGLLQVGFTHAAPEGASGQGLEFVLGVHKDAGEEIERSLVGYFYDGGRSSVWTLALAPEELEDNHLIAKKLRRMKQSLEKVFTGEEWCGPALEGSSAQGSRDLLRTVSSEHVVFEEGAVFHAGEAPVKPSVLNSHRAFEFLTDGYGPSCSLVQVEVWIRSTAPELLLSGLQRSESSEVVLEAVADAVSEPSVSNAFAPGEGLNPSAQA